MPGTIFWTSITGITVSGVVGPAANAWATRLANRSQFVRDREAAKRDDLRALFDDAAQVLGVGPIRLRQIWEQDHDAETVELVRGWPDEVYVIGQRIKLRLGADSPIATAYDRVREGLRTAAEIPPGETARRDASLDRFEADRDAFLAASLAKLKEPIPEKPKKK